jgi:hypothetical protein
MPYITKNQREFYSPFLGVLRDRLIDNPNPGEINYCLSSVIWSIFEDNKSYATANMLLGVLEAVKQEFYRRQVAPYEDAKQQENGDLPRDKTQDMSDYEREVEEHNREAEKKAQEEKETCPYCKGDHSILKCPILSRAHVKPDSENSEYFKSHHGY